MNMHWFTIIAAVVGAWSLWSAVRHHTEAERLERELAPRWDVKLAEGPEPVQ